MICNVDEKIIRHLLETGEEDIKDIIRYSIEYFAYINGYKEKEFQLPTLICEKINSAGEYKWKENKIYINDSLTDLEEVIKVIIHESIHAAQYIYDDSIEELLTANDKTYYHDSPIEMEAHLLTRYIQPMVLARIIVPYYKVFLEMALSTAKSNFRDYELKIPPMLARAETYFDNLKVPKEKITIGECYKQIRLYYSISQAIMSTDEAYSSLKNIDRFISNRVEFLK